jgi:hypothetical protein
LETARRHWACEHQKSRWLFLTCSFFWNALLYIDFSGICWFFWVNKLCLFFCSKSMFKSDGLVRLESEINYEMVYQLILAKIE